MNHFTLHTKPEKIGKEFLLPFLCQFLLVGLAILPHRLCIGRGDLLLPSVEYLGEMTSPTAGRLFFAVTAMILCIVLGVVASKLARNDRIFPSFLTGIFAGTLLWQSIGEDLWHFGIYSNGELINFLKIENVQVLPIVIPFLLLVLYGMIHHSFDFGVLCLIMSFLSNWMGHYCSHATYPLVESIIELKQWYIISGACFGGVLLLFGIYLGLFASKDQKGRIFSSIIAYIGLAVFVFGMIG